MFYLDLEHEIAVAQIPKCGLNTIREWLGRSAIVVSNNDPRLLETKKRVAFIRHPIERLKSAFSFFYWLNDYGTKHSCNAPLDSWESFVDHVLNPDIPDDEHWLPQCEHINNVANIYHRFENIANHFEKYRPGILPHNNRSSHREANNYRMPELMAKYIVDYNLHKEAE